LNSVQYLQAGMPCDRKYSKVKKYGRFELVPLSATFGRAAHAIQILPGPDLWLKGTCVDARYPLLFKGRDKEKVNSNQ
jgi:hypothetical protein